MQSKNIPITVNFDRTMPNRYVTGYDRSKGGLQKAARAYMQKAGGKKRTYKSAMTKAVTAAVKAVAEKKQVWHGINQDDISFLLTTNDNFALVNGVQMNTGAMQRIGRQISLESVRVRATFVARFTATATEVVHSTTIRAILLWDADPHSAAFPTFNQIFGNYNEQGGQQTTLVSGVLPQMRGRFRILREWCFDMNAPTWMTDASNGVVEQQKSIDEFVSLKGKTTVFSGTANPIQIVNVQSGALIWVVRAEATNALCKIMNAQTILTYTDM